LPINVRDAFQLAGRPHIMSSVGAHIFPCSRARFTRAVSTAGPCQLKLSQSELALTTRRLPARNQSATGKKRIADVQICRFCNKWCCNWAVICYFNYLLTLTHSTTLIPTLILTLALPLFRRSAHPLFTIVPTSLHSPQSRINGTASTHGVIIHYER